MNDRRTILLWAILVIGLLCVASSAAAVALVVGDGAGVSGQTVQVPVYLTDAPDPIYSVELELSWYQYYFTLVGVETAGTESAAWSMEWSTSPGEGHVALAGASPIVGGGLLCYLEFSLELGNGSGTIYLQDAVINEDPVPPSMEDGSISVSPLPTVDIYPDSGVIPVGETLSFNTYSGVAPYTYTSSDPAVADFTGGDNVLVGLTAGTVQVSTEDSMGTTDTTTGVIEVRPFVLRALNMSTTEGRTLQVPLTLIDPGPYGIYSAELDVHWSGSSAEFLGVQTAGTLMATAGWSTPEFQSGPGTANIVAAGASPLPGAGILCFLEFRVQSSFWLYLEPGLFNETWQAFDVDGYITVNPLPVITLAPSGINLLVGNEIQLELSGMISYPVSYTSTNPGVVDISPTGLVTGVSAGWTDIWMEDSLGARTNTIHLEVFDFALPSITTRIHANETLMVPIKVERSLTGLGITSYELEIDYSSYYVEYLGTTTAGSASEDWGTPLAVDEGNSVRVYHAGAAPLSGCPSALVYLEFRGLPTIGGGNVSAASIDAALFNEGSPRVLINAGTPCVVSGVPLVPGAGGLMVGNHPNPFNPGTTVSYAVGTTGGPARLAVYSSRGQLVRVLLKGELEAGASGQVYWDGRDDGGRMQPSGVYFSRMEVGPNMAMGKMVLLK